MNNEQIGNYEEVDKQWLSSEELKEISFISEGEMDGLIDELVKEPLKN